MVQAPSGGFYVRLCAKKCTMPARSESQHRGGLGRRLIRLVRCRPRVRRPRGQLCDPRLVGIARVHGRRTPRIVSCVPGSNYSSDDRLVPTSRTPRRSMRRGFGSDQVPAKTIVQGLLTWMMCPVGISMPLCQSTANGTIVSESMLAA